MIKDSGLLYFVLYTFIFFILVINVDASEPANDDDETWYTEEEWNQIGGGAVDEDQPGPSGGRAIISERYRQNVKRFGTTATAYDVTFENLDKERDVENLARETIQVSSFLYFCKLCNFKITQITISYLQ